jgi:hypothetical protein
LLSSKARLSSAVAMQRTRRLGPNVSATKLALLKDFDGAQAVLRGEVQARQEAQGLFGFFASMLPGAVAQGRASRLPTPRCFPPPSPSNTPSVTLALAPTVALTAAPTPATHAAAASAFIPDESHHACAGATRKPPLQVAPSPVAATVNQSHDRRSGELSKGARPAAGQGEVVEASCFTFLGPLEA